MFDRFSLDARWIFVGCSLNLCGLPVEIGVLVMDVRCISDGSIFDRYWIGLRYLFDRSSLGLRSIFDRYSIGRRSSFDRYSIGLDR